MTDNQVQLLEERIRRLAPVQNDPDWAEVARRAKPPRRRRRLVVAAGLAVVVGIAAALAPAWLANRGDVDVIERALAAVSNGPVLHAVLEGDFNKVATGPGMRFSVVDLETRRERPPIVRSELWYDPERQLLRHLWLVEGSVRAEFVQTGNGTVRSAERETSGPPPSVPPALAAFFKGYRAALAEGRAEVSGTEAVDGRNVTWVRFPPSADDAYGVMQEVAVDTETYEPVLLRTICARCPAPAGVWRVVTLEGISESGADFTRPTLRTREGEVHYGRSAREELPLAAVSAALGQVALWAGPSVAGIPFSGVQSVFAPRYSAFPPSKASLIDRTRGLAFYYGLTRTPGGRYEAVHGRPNFTISQSPDFRGIFAGFNFDNARAGEALAVGGIPVPPEGQAVLTASGEEHFSIQLRKGALYVEIDGSSRHAVLEAARALRPVEPD